MLKRESDRDRAEKEEGEKCNVDPFVSSATVGALTASWSMLRSVAPLKPGLFSLAHTHQTIMVGMIPFISVSLWMHLFSKVILY